MKKMIWYYSLFFLFLFFLFGLEYMKRFLLHSDELLSESLIYEYDYLSLKKEYEELNNYLEWSNHEELPMITSKVVFKDPYHFYEEMTILKGEDASIRKGDMVVNEKGYVGRVKRVDRTSSLVELLYHPQTQMAVSVEGNYGILMIENHRVLVKKVTIKEPVNLGSIVTTSKYSKVPYEIPIGKVVEVSTGSNEQVLVVEPFVDFEALNYVSIRKGMDL